MFHQDSCFITTGGQRWPALVAWGTRAPPRTEKNCLLSGGNKRFTVWNVLCWLLRLRLFYDSEEKFMQNRDNHEASPGVPCVPNVWDYCLLGDLHVQKICELTCILCNCKCLNCLKQRHSARQWTFMQYNRNWAMTVNFLHYDTSNTLFLGDLVSCSF